MTKDHEKYVLGKLKETLQECMCEVARKGLEEAMSTKNIQPVHKDVLHLKQPFLKTGAKHFIKVAKRFGTKSYIMNGLLNMERWFKNTKPEVSRHARSIINDLEKSPTWQELKTKHEPEMLEK